jgi:hypothetical protein
LKNRGEIEQVVLRAFYKEISLNVNFLLLLPSLACYAFATTLLRQF